MGETAKLRKGFTIGSWEVLPDRGLVRDGDTEEHLEPLVMNVLVALANARGEVLTKDDLNDIVWDGRIQGDEPLTRCISILRRKLGDDRKEPTYIQNIPRVGYRLMVPVVVPEESKAPAANDVSVWTRRNVLLVVGMIVVAILVVPPGVEWIRRIIFPPPPVESMAIMPFECADNTESYLCFGFSEELASTLSQLQSGQFQMTKIHRARDSQPVPADICERFGPDVVLFGIVQKMADQLRIFPEVIDCGNGSTRWSGTIDGPVTEIFRLQENTATAVTQSLFPDIREALRSASRPASFAAFRPYAQGMVQFEERSRASIERSIELFEESIEVDPMFGPAYLRQANAYLLLPEYDNSLSIESTFDTAAAIVEQGIAADPSIRETAQTVFGFIHHKRGEWMQAHAAFETAVNAATVYPVTRNWYSRFLGSVGRMDDALTQAQLAYESAPVNPSVVSRLAVAHLWLGQTEEAGRFFEDANDLEPESPIHHLAYSVYLIRTGQIAAAKTYAQQGLQAYGQPSEWVDPVFDGFTDPSLVSRSVEIVAELEDSSDLGRYVIMSLWGLLGQADRAIATARKLPGIGQDYELAVEILFTSDLASSREHAEFAALLDEFGLTEYWAAIGCTWADAALSCQ